MNNKNVPDSVSTEHSEADLIMRLRNKDMKAFEELYEEYRKRLSYFISSMINKPQIVEEVFNDTMLVVWQKINDFAGASKLSTWIYAIAYRKAIRARSKIDEPVASENTASHDIDDNGTEESLERGQLNRVLTGALAKLSNDHRMVVKMTYFEGMHYRDIAEIMDCPVDTVKTRMFHAKRHLKKVLGGNIIDYL